MVQGVGGAITDVFHSVIEIPYHIPIYGELAFTHVPGDQARDHRELVFQSPVLLNDAASSPIVFDIYDLVIAGAKIA